MIKISATIITLNEERNLGPCLESLGFADEIIVVDSGSTDGTEALCRAYPRVRFVDNEWLGFGRQKNHAADLCRNEWVFNVDADERVSAQLAQSIMNADFSLYSSFRVARENYFGDKWIKYCGWYPDFNLRLYNRTRAKFSEREVHEAVECSGEVGTLAGNLVHRTYAGVSDYLKRMDRYSTLAAKQMLQDGKFPGRSAIVTRPISTFLKMYVLKQGFREGYYGLLLSSLYAYYTLCKYAKAIELKTAAPSD